MRLNALKNIRDRIIFLDGGQGTLLQQSGMPQGVCPEIWAKNNREVLRDIHRAYVEAGAEIIYTCTFGGNRLKLSQFRQKDVKGINRELARIAKQAAGAQALVAGDIGPTGKFVEPFGGVKFEQAVDIFKEQISGLISGGADLLVIETMMDIQEARAALIAAKETAPEIFTIVTMTYEKNGRTLNGTDPVSALITLQSLGADAVGCNCSAGPLQMNELIKKMKPFAKVPLVAKPNAGMPRLAHGSTVFDMSASEFAFCSRKLIKSGANFVGGCCGTTPEHIRELKKTLKEKKAVAVCRKSIAAISSARSSLLLTPGKEPVIVGECINPTGKKSFQQQLKKGNLKTVRDLAREQESKGALALDVNAGVPEADEAALMLKMVSMLSLNSRLPLVIDSSDPLVIEKALRVYPGRAMINSISAEKHKLTRVLPLAAKYGAMIIILPLSEKELPKKFPERKAIALKIFREARKFGFGKEDVVVDGLILAVSSFPRAACETIRTVNWFAKKFGVNTIGGLSNISFGMPQRNLMNQTFLSLLKRNGLSMIIANPLPEKIKPNSFARDVLLARDKDAARYIKYAQKLKDSFTRENKSLRRTGKGIREDIYQCVLDGDRKLIKKYLSTALKQGVSALDIVDKAMIPAINRVGDLFDKKECFLPQLIASAETMKLGFEYLRPALETAGRKNEKKTVIILATVKGDIHDIGKNIVGLMLKNHGFEVIDLGKDVSAAKIISQVKKHDCGLVGLSALMTTTMVNMKEVLSLAGKEGLSCRFIVGGAVVTKSYADSLGAEYAADGVQAVKAALKLAKIKA